MSKASDPKIKEFSGEEFTKITFSPDLPKFKMDSLDSDTVALLSRRAYDIAASSKGVKVFLNGKRVPVSALATLVRGKMVPVKCVSNMSERKDGASKCVSNMSERKDGASKCVSNMSERKEYIMLWLLVGIFILIERSRWHFVDGVELGGGVKSRASAFLLA